MATGTVASQPAPRPRLGAFAVPGFALVWLSGLLWHLSRWGVAFLGTVLVNDLTGSPRLVQLTGTVLYAPLLVGGVVGGMMSDRFDRLASVRVQMAVIAPLTVLIGVAVRTDRIEVWMLYVFMFMVGAGWVTDMTSRRALVFDLVGDERLGQAMALESLSLSSGMVIGALVGGSAIEAVGIGSAYFFIAGFVALAFVLLIPVTSPPVIRAASSATPLRDLLDGLRQLRSNRGVVSILGVTAIANFFLFAYFPIVPVVAERLGARPIEVGLLAAGTGMGMMTASVIVARLQPHRRGLVYVGGVVVAMVMVTPFALAGRLPIALASIIGAGIGGGFFGAMQSTLVMAEAPEHLRGRALGLLSMAIGALPIGMYALGELAERLGVTTALMAHTWTGLVVLALWLTVRPEVRRLTA